MTCGDIYEMMQFIRMLRSKYRNPVIVCNPVHVAQVGELLVKYANDGETVAVFPREYVPKDAGGGPAIFVVDMADYIDQLHKAGYFTEGKHE